MGAGQVFILGDFDLLVEAIANLVDNAIKFTPSGGLVSITVKANLAGFLIRVSDNGPGIAPFEREQIFERILSLPEKRMHPILTALSVLVERRRCDLKDVLKIG